MKHQTSEHLRRSVNCYVNYKSKLHSRRCCDDESTCFLLVSIKYEDILHNTTYVIFEKNITAPKTLVPHLSQPRSSQHNPASVC